MPNQTDSASGPSLGGWTKSRSATVEATANGLTALVLAFLGDELAHGAMLAVAVGCVVAGAVVRGMTDRFSRRSMHVNLPAGWEWVTPCVQVGLAMLIAWHLGAALGMLAAALTAGAAIPAIDSAKRRWQALSRLVSWGG